MGAWGCDLGGMYRRSCRSLRGYVLVSEVRRRSHAYLILHEWSVLLLYCLRLCPGLSIARGYGCECVGGVIRSTSVAVVVGHDLWFLHHLGLVDVV